MDKEILAQNAPVTRLWAKSDPYHPLWCHLLDVAAVCEALLPHFGGIEDLPVPWLLFLTAMHDIGKADARFVGKAPELDLADLVVASPGECLGFRHEARSAEWIKTHLETLGWNPRASNVVARAIRGHHADFTAEAYNEDEFADYVAFYPPLRAQLAAVVYRTLQVEPFTLDQFENASAAGMKLSGLIVLSDWIASNPETYPYYNLHGVTDPDEYFRFARREAQGAVRRLGLDTPQPDEVSTLARDEIASLPTFVQVWPALAGKSLRPIQQVLEQACLEGVPVGMAIIEAPMGEGKTEAALYLKEYWAKRGAYFALPTQATSNQMHRRYTEFLQTRRPGSIPRLVHGMAWLLDEIAHRETARTSGEEGDGEEGERLLSREWFQNAKRALLAPDGVGTVDQVLMAALNVKHGFLRFLGLSNKVLIIDEVHAYDIYMTTLMQTLLRWCRALNIPVILLSATLSSAQKKTLVEAYGGNALLSQPADTPAPYPLLTFVPLQGTPFIREVPADASRNLTVALKLHQGALDDPVKTARLAAATVASGGCACVLVNTVRSAQMVYRALETLVSEPVVSADTELFLFHARFRAECRQEIEKKVIDLFGKEAGQEGKSSRPGKAILVATQVVEQSLDVDFDVMLTEIAPIDFVLQRMGRMHRHPQNDPRPTGGDAVLHIFLPEENDYKFAGTGIVYEPETLLRTLAVLQGRDEIHLPVDFRPLIEICYGAATFPVSGIPAELLQKATENKTKRRLESSQNARQHLVPDPSPRVFRYGEPQVSKPVAEGEEGARVSYFRAQTREGDDSRNVLVLHDLRLIKLVRTGIEKPSYQPRRQTLKRLFLQKASIPAWWLHAVIPAEGFEIMEGPKWLSHHLILVMKDGVWQGENKDGKRVIIQDDETLGLLCSIENEHQEEKKGPD